MPAFTLSRSRKLLPQTLRLLALLGAEEGAGSSRARGGSGRVEPVLRGLLVRRGDHFDHVAVPQLVAEQLELPVHPRAGDVLPELGVDREDEVDRRRPARKTRTSPFGVNT